MIFRDFAESVLGSGVKIKVLMYLLSEGMPTSEREISRIIRVSHTAVNKVMKDFYDANLITPMKIGNVKAWRINEKSYAFKAISDINFLAKRPPLQYLKDDIQGWLSSYSGIKKVIMFGSVAEGKELPESDIDLFVLVHSESEKRTIIAALSNKIGYCAEFYGNKLSPYVLTDREMEENKNKKLLQNIERGIVVIG